MKINKSLTALIAGASLGLSGQAYSAANYEASTAANTLISNSATINFKVDSVDLSSDTSISFRVDNKVDLNVTAQGSTTYGIAPTGPAAGSYYVAPFIIRNDGNLTQDYKFVAADLPELTGNTGPDVTDSSDTATTGLFNVFVDNTSTGSIGSYDIGDNIQFVDNLAPGSTALVFVVINNTNTVASTLINGDVAVVSLTAITMDAGQSTLATLANNHNDVYVPGSVQVVFADSGSDGQEQDTTAFEVKIAAFTDPAIPANQATLVPLAINDFICKGSDVLAADNTDYSGATNCPSAGASYVPKSIPNSQVKFTYAGKNTGAVAAANAEYKKTLTGDYRANSLANATATVTLDSGNGAVTNIAAGDIAITGTNGEILTITLGTVAVDAVVDITYTAIVD